MQKVKLMYLLAVSASVFCLGGCGNRPPGCTDDETIKTAKSMLVNGASQRFYLVPPVDIKGAEGMISSYLSAYKVELVNAVSNGYNAETKKQSCQAKMVVSNPNGEHFEEEVAYTTQSTEGGKSKFILSIQNIDPGALADEALKYYLRNRYQGVWKGTYQCAALSGFPDGGDNQPVTSGFEMIVKPDNKIEFKTSDGKSQLAWVGEIGWDDRSHYPQAIATMKSSLAKTMEPKLGLRAFGRFNGDTLVGQGERIVFRPIQLGNGEIAHDTTQYRGECVIKAQRAK